jgi:aminoglycoside phosphotransferase (APT) family kinase protein
VGTNQPIVWKARLSHFIVAGIAMASSDPTTHAGVAHALAPWLSARLGGEVDIVDLRRHNEGFSWETYTFRARWPQPGGEFRERGLVVRREPDDGILPPYDAAAQHALHAALLEHSAVPMPALYWLEEDQDVLGRPFYVMELVEGTIPVQWAADDPALFPDEDARRDVGLQFVDVLASIHQVDWRRPGFEALDRARSPQDTSAHEVQRLVALYERHVRVEIPVVREAFEWLRARPCSSRRLVLCHGDYRIGNFIIDRRRRIAAILDWEMAHVGDPARDVAWAAMKLFRGRSRKWSHLLEPEEFLARYEERTGLAFTPEVLHHWTVMTLVTTTIAHLAAARAFEEGRSGDLRLAALGHQIVRPVHQLAQALRAESPWEAVTR